MKKGFIILSIALFSALFALSCQSLSVSIEEVTQPEGRTFTCVFAQPDPGTKINVDLSNGKTTWKVGDKILINAGSSGTSRRTVTLTAGDIFDEGKKAIITIPGDLVPYDRKKDRGIESSYYAMYPADNVASGNLYYNQAFSNQNDFLMAACNVGDTFVFYNLCGVIAYTVDDGESYDFDQVVFAGKDGETVAYDTYQARVRDDGSGAYVEYIKAADTYSPLVPRTSCTNSVVSDGSAMNYIFIPGGATFTSGITFSFKSGGDIKKTASASFAEPKAVPPGYILKLGDISTHLKTYTPPAAHNSSIDMSGAIDLSSTASSNCYLLDSKVSVAANQVYKFKAYQGKSTTGVGAIASVSILWETYNNLDEVESKSVIADVDFDKQGSDDFYTMVFKMPDSITPGNAVIAAKDALGGILWSWHIWVPSTDVDDVDGSAILGANIMDRNLGALVVAPVTGVAPIESVGMIYQWGRKDPFPGVGSWSASTCATVAGTAPSIGGQFASISASLASPTVFGVASDWIPGSDRTRWGTSKTIYDPCPVGYKIPSGAKGKTPTYPLWGSDDDNSDIIKDLVNAKDPAWTWDENTTNHVIKIEDASSNVITIPYAGYVSESTSSYKISYYTSRTGWWFYPTNSTSIYHINLRTDGTYQAGSTSAGRGLSVRCVAE